jgi:uncharacterized protein (TIRG00374 family)
MLSSLFQNIYFRAGLAILISAVTLILAIRHVTVQDIRAAISAADIRFVLLALLSVVVNNLAKTFRWRVLLGNPGKTVSFWVILQAVLVGQTLNYIYPARIGDLSRVYIVGDRGAGRIFTIGTLVLEKLLDLLFYALLILLMAVSMPLPGWFSSWANQAWIVLIGASLGAIVILLIIAYHRDWFINKYGIFLGFLSRGFPFLKPFSSTNWFRSGIDSLEILKNRNDLFLISFWLVISWATALLNNQLALLALGIHLPLTASLLVLVVLQAGISIPSVPGRIGVFEYICVLTLAIFGVGQSAAFSYGILLHSIVFIPLSLLGLLCIILLGLPIRQVTWIEATRENR